MYDRKEERARGNARKEKKLIRKEKGNIENAAIQT